jgi:hypothetical protein
MGKIRLQLLYQGLGLGMGHHLAVRHLGWCHLRVRHLRVTLLHCSRLHEGLSRSSVVVEGHDF